MTLEIKVVLYLYSNDVTKDNLANGLILTTITAIILDAFKHKLMLIIQSNKVY